MNLSDPGIVTVTATKSNSSRIPEVAERLHVATRTVRRWIKSGDLVAHRFGGVVRIAERICERFQHYIAKVNCRVWGSKIVTSCQWHMEYREYS